MSDNAPIVPPPPSAPKTVLSAELEQVLDFTAKENQKHREFFEGLYTTTARALTVIFVGVGLIVSFIGWHTIGDIRKQAQDATAEELKRTQQQVQQALKQETELMRAQVSSRIDKEFETSAIRNTVLNAANQQTRSVMLPIISKEVHSQVSVGVQNEQNSIKATLGQQATLAVERLQPVIDKTVEQRINSDVDVAFKKQVEPQLSELKSNAEISSLIARAQGGDAASFDILSRIATDETTKPELKVTADRVVSSIVQANNSTFYNPLHFTKDFTVQQKVDFLQNASGLQRRAAVDDIAETYWRENMDRLYTIMMSDEDLTVRTAAYVRFKAITKAQFLNLDAGSAVLWWGEHRKDFVKR